MRSLPITGWSSICALGESRQQIRDRLYRGESGLRTPPSWFPHPTECGSVELELRSLSGELAAFDCRQARVALAIAEQLAEPIAECVERWGPSRVAMILGTSTGGIEETELALQAVRDQKELPESYDMGLQHNFYAFVQLLKTVVGVRGPSYVVSTACSSSAKVFASGARLIEANLADAVIVGGVDTLCKTTLFGFHSLGILADQRCRPFGADRPGINLGEGGALFILEREGDAPVWLRGVGESSDAHHMTSPHPEGRGAILAMQRALESADVKTDEVGAINAHGTGTVKNDASESQAITTMFGDSIPVVSTKGFTGHALGAAGALEAAFSLINIEEGWLPASLGSDPRGPEIEASVSCERRELATPMILSNSFGFGGNNASVLFGKKPA